MKLPHALLLLGTLFLAGCTPPAAPAQSGCDCSMTSIIFFDSGSASLSPKNLAAVQQDANFYARQAPHPIYITAGADTAEAATDSAISLQRTKTVGLQLVADGVPEAAIFVQDNGTQHPMVPTGPGVAQIMNRYAMVKIQLAPPAVAASAGPFQMRSVALYQNNATLVARLGANGARSLATYVGQIRARLTALLAAVPPQPGVTAALVVGVKPDGAVRTWIVAPAGGLSPALAAQIQSAALAVPPVVVQNGPIAFAIIFNAWGGGAPITDQTHPVPLPTEWTAGATGPELLPDGVFARIWP
jgi:hypothetical protein